MMNAAVYTGTDVKLQHIPVPKLSVNQVLVKVLYCGICGTDIAIINGSLKPSCNPPLVIGHELTGYVVDTSGKDTLHLMGKRVVAEINTSLCNSCFYCRNSMPTHCISRKALGIGRNGGFAEYIALESSLLHEIPDIISYKEATFVEPLAAAFRVFETMKIDVNSDNHWKTIVIFGLGKLGLLITQVSSAVIKLPNIIVVDISEKKLEMALKLGANFSINSSKVDPVILIKKFTKDLGADIVVDATGNETVISQVISSCRSRGYIHLKSTHGKPCSVNLTEIVVRELTVFSSRCGSFPVAINFLKNHTIKVKELISDVVSLKDINYAFNLAKSTDSIKIIVDCQCETDRKKEKKIKLK